MGRMVKEILIKSKVLQILFLGFILSISVSAQVPDWYIKLKEVKVFQSSKQDVGRIFEYPNVSYWSRSKGRPDNSWGESFVYETKNGKLDVFYSTGKCSELTGKRGWDIDEGLVVSIEFEPTKPIKLSKLNLDLSTFKREKSSDTAFWRYWSDQLGVNFGVLQNKVTWFEYSITDEMSKLDCEKVLKEKSK